MKVLALLPAVCALSLAACAGASSSGRAGAAPGSAAAAPAEVVQVFKSDGSRQCEREGALSPAEMQALELADVTVLAARKDVLRGVAFPAVCGGATGSVNVFSIAAADWPRVQARGFARWQPQK